MEKRNLLSLLFLSLVVLHVMAEETEQDSDDFSYEIIGANSASDSSPEKGNYQHFGIFHSRPASHSRQRRSPHFGGHGLYHGYHHRPYPHHYPHHHPHGWGGHHGNSHSHSQAQAISANFGGPHWNAGFSGAAASSGSGGGSNLNYFGHGK